MTETKLVKVTYQQSRLEFFKKQLDKATRSMNYHVKRKHHPDICAEYGEIASFYEWAVDKAKEPGWIPVTDRLPDSNRTVLVSALTKCFRHRHTLMVSHVGHHEFTTEDIEWREYEGETEYDEQNDCFWIPECWYEVNAIDDNGNWIIDSEYDVTHWMPLPEPPKEEK
jgi:hypothetical protein